MHKALSIPSLQDITPSTLYLYNLLFQSVYVAELSYHDLSRLHAFSMNYLQCPKASMLGRLPDSASEGARDRNLPFE